MPKCPALVQNPMVYLPATSVTFCAPEAHTSLLEQAQRRPESLLAVFKRTLARLKIGAHASNLFGLCSDEAHLVIRHLPHQHRRKGVVGEIAQQVTLNHLLGDGADEVFDFFLYEENLAVSSKGPGISRAYLKGTLTL